jgi:hypothetical protein
MRSEARGKAESDLKREWGNTYDGNVTAAKTAISQFADPDFVQYLDESGLGNDPRMTRVMSRIGKALVGETKLKGTPPPGGTNAVDLDKAISEHRDRYKDALFDKGHPDHERVFGEYTRLFQQKFPDA